MKNKNDQNEVLGFDSSSSKYLVFENHHPSQIKQHYFFTSVFIKIIRLQSDDLKGILSFSHLI